MDRYALFGHPVSHSRSPAIHHAFAEQTGELLRYELIDVPGDFTTAALSFFAAGGKGANITLPHKLAAFEFASTLTGRARRAGAVNTLMAEEDGILGDNTDGAGLLRDLIVNHAVKLRGARVLLLGASGAARGALGPLLNAEPAGIFIANRTVAKAKQLQNEFADARITSGGYDDIHAQFDIIINATSASLADEIPPVPASAIHANTCAYDMVYRQELTPFLQWAARHGAAKTLDGWGMMVEQAAESFELWRGVRPGTKALLSTAFRHEQAC